MKFFLNSLLIAALAAGSLAAPTPEAAALAAPAEAVEDYVIVIDKEKREAAPMAPRSEAVEDYVIVIDKEKRAEAVEDYVILVDKEKRHGLHGDKH